jgi:hypothetical protein
MTTTSVSTCVVKCGHASRRGVFWGSGVLGILMGLLSPVAAIAGSPGPLADKFFDAVKSVAPDPDEVELARYYVYEPAHAEPVYSKASGQDYVFIGILVGAKAARNQKFPGVGVFDYDACMIPINTFNAVFAKSGDFINKYGQEDHIKAYAHAENKEAKDKASSELAEYVPYWEDIPHICHFTFFTSLQREKDMKNTFSDRIKTMKKSYEDFADGNIVGGVDKLIAVGVNGKVACTLADDVIGGGLIGKTPVLGNIAKEACAGFAGKVIGTAVDIANYVPGQVITGVSNLGDELAGQTKHMPTDQYYQQYWAPRVAEGVAQGKAGNWTPFIKSIWNPCVSYFDKHTMSAANARKTCDYHRDALFAPAVQALQKAQDNQVVIDKNLPIWVKEFGQKWYPLCVDSPCEHAIQALMKSAQGEGQNLRESHAADGWIYIANALGSYSQSAASEIEASKGRSAAVNTKITAQASLGWADLYVGAWKGKCSDDLCLTDLQTLGKQMVVAASELQAKEKDESSGHVQGQVSREYGAKFQKAIDDSKFRATNKKITAQASLGWADLYVGAWKPKCADEACRNEVQALGSAMVVEAKQLQAKEKDESSSHIQGQLGKEYGAKFQKSIDDSKHRLIAADPKAKADDRLPWLGCKPFLARPGEWLCQGDPGFDACVGYVKSGTATNCFNGTSKGHYMTFERLVAFLGNVGCKHQGSGREFECASEKAMDDCGQLNTGGSQIVCNAPQAHKDVRTSTASPRPVDTRVTSHTERHDSAPPIRLPVDVKAELGKQGCRSYLGRDDEYLCPRGPAFDACEGFQKKGQAKLCRPSR